MDALGFGQQHSRGAAGAFSTRHAQGEQQGQQQGQLGEAKCQQQPLKEHMRLEPWDSTASTAPKPSHADSDGGGGGAASNSCGSPGTQQELPAAASEGVGQPAARSAAAPAAQPARAARTALNGRTPSPELDPTSAPEQLQPAAGCAAVSVPEIEESTQDAADASRHASPNGHHAAPDITLAAPATGSPDSPAKPVPSSPPSPWHPNGHHAAPDSGHAAPATSSPNPPLDPVPPSPPSPWQKVLWKRQPWPDNHTDASFLQELVVNAGLVPVRRYWPVVMASVAVSQQLCTVVAALAVPAHLSFGSLSVHTLLAACAALLVLGYATCAWLGGHLLGGPVSRGLRQCALLVGGVLFLSPLLRSLTRTVSEDSVVSLTAALLLAHLFLHDYNFVNSVTDRLTGAVSLTTAVLAAVLVASLMPSDLAVFAQVLFSLELYLLWPYARRYIHRCSPAAHVGLTLLAAAASCALLWPLSRALALLHLLSLAMLTFVCPWWLVSSHKFKAKINGPWDEAVPHIPRQLLLASPAAAGNDTSS